MKSIIFKNFRNSGTEITRINLRSVSLFTGCNSAGKSSAAKALILLNSYLQDVKNNNNNLIDTPLDFSTIVKLGSFDHVLNKQAKENGASSIMLGFSTESFFNVGEIEYQFFFVKKDGDFLENGWLESLAVYVNNTPLFTIKIVDNHYQIKVDDSKGLVRYYRNYMIKQLAMAYRYAQGCNDYIASCSEEDREFIKDDIKDIEFVEAISSLDLHSVLQEEEQLIAEGCLEKHSNPDGLNFSLLKGIEQYKVDGLCANVLRYNSIDLLITQIETQNGRKLSLADIDSVVTEYEKRAIIKSEAIISISKHPERLTKLFPQQINKRKNELIKTLKEYIKSDATCRMEYARKQEGNLIDEYVADYNESTRLCADSFDKNVLAFYFPFKNSGGISGFVDNLIEKAINPDFCGNLKYVDASTVDVKRLYQVDDSSKFGKSWKLFNELSKRYDENNSSRPIKPGQFMQKWLKELGICNDFVVSNVEGAISIRLITDDVPEGRPLADYGYGVTQLLSLLLNIEIVLNNIGVRYMVDINNEPLYDYTPFWIVIEEPEVHLHPGLQSKLADMFRDASHYGARFIIETHSEYMVRRSQTLVAQMGLDDAELEKRNPFIVYYFPENGFPYDMKFQPNGHFEESFGTGFFDEAGKWSRELIRTKRR